MATARETVWYKW